MLLCRFSWFARHTGCCSDIFAKLYQFDRRSRAICITETIELYRWQQWRPRLHRVFIHPGPNYQLYLLHPGPNLPGICSPTSHLHKKQHPSRNYQLYLYIQVQTCQEYTAQLLIFTRSSSSKISLPGHQAPSKQHCALPLLNCQTSCHLHHINC